MKPTFAPSAAYGALSKYGMVNEVTNVVMIEMTEARRFVFSFTRVEAASETTTYETGAQERL